MTEAVERHITAALDPIEFDWRNPDYTAIFRQRTAALMRIRERPECLPQLKAFYRENPAAFINDWGLTFDPRGPEVGRPSVIPFILFPRQVEFIEWLLERWRAREPGVCPKSREMGITWTAVAFACTMCLFHKDLAIGFGSRKLELVDNLGDPDAILPKARDFLDGLPPEFLGGWTRKDAPEKRIKFPGTGSVIKGEGGDEIGRGGRQTMYLVDESAFLEHPLAVEKSLSQTTNCRIDLSTPNGIGGPFYDKVHEWPSERIFRFHWRQDPRKDDAWYEKQKSELDPVTVAQEIDMDFAASVEGVVIPSDWVQSAIDAHIKLGIAPTGKRGGSLDVADEGKDKNAFCVSEGIVVRHVEEWSGKGSDIFSTVQRAHDLADEWDLDEYDYDSDGLGAGVRGDARVVNEERERNGQRTVEAVAFRGSAGVIEPEAEDVPKRKNKDHFMNRKAQMWWRLRLRFQATHRAVQAVSVTAAHDYDPDELISLDSQMQGLSGLVAELSQPVFYTNTIGKKLVDKAPKMPNGAQNKAVRSPNKADTVMIRFATSDQAPMVMDDEDALQVLLS